MNVLHERPIICTKGESTEYIIESIDFSVDIPDYQMTKAALRK